MKIVKKALFFLAIALPFLIFAILFWVGQLVKSVGEAGLYVLVLLGEKLFRAEKQAEVEQLILESIKRK